MALSMVICNNQACKRRRLELDQNTLCWNTLLSLVKLNIQEYRNNKKVRLGEMKIQAETECLGGDQENERERNRETERKTQRERDRERRA